VASAAAGLLSKPMVVTLPAVLWLLDDWPLKRCVTLSQRLVEKIPFIALSIGSSIITVYAQSTVNAVIPLARMPVLGRVNNALISYVGYMGKCFWPVDLAIYYPYPYHQPIWLAMAAVLLLGAITLASVRLRRTHPFLMMGWLWYLGTLVPVIGLVQVGNQAMADRYSYVPLLGIFIMAVWGACDWTQRHARRVRGMSGVAGGLLVVCAILTSRQLGYWRDNETLFRHALAVTERNWVAHQCLGRALAHDPARLDEAITHCRAVVYYVPKSAKAHFSLGTVLVQRAGNQTEGMAEFHAALALDSNYAPAHMALGRELRQMPGRLSDAVRELETAVRLTPEDYDSHYELAQALAELPEREAESIAEYRAALQLSPEVLEAHNNLAIVLARQPKSRPEAIAEYEIVLRAKPDYAEVHNNLANALMQSPGRGADAISEYKRALRLKPDYYEAEFNFGFLLSQISGCEAEALMHFERALKINPECESARLMRDRLRSATTH
jgi:tetratricopeptide (TPR) repeat protein